MSQRSQFESFYHKQDLYAVIYTGNEIFLHKIFIDYGKNTTSQLVDSSFLIGDKGQSQDRKNKESPRISSMSLLADIRHKPARHERSAYYIEQKHHPCKAW